MTARPILFSGAMVRALLDGTKTQTRRIVKEADNGVTTCIEKNDEWPLYAVDKNGAWHPRPCPYGKPGDLLWVRETISYQWPDNCDDGRVYPDNEGADIREFGRPIKQAECDILYAATDLDAEWMGDNGEPCKPRWKPSIHMPRRASRITLEITDVRVERLQDISEADAIAEGILKSPEHELLYRHYMGDKTYAENGYGLQRTIWVQAVESYRSLWESINGDGAWAINPWVWVVEFTVHKRNVDELLRERGAA